MVGMAGNTVNYSLSTIYRDLINVPRLKSPTNTSPLYAITDSREAAEAARGLNRDPLWIETSSHSYNSPTNVRRVYLSHSHVCLEFYTPFILKGQPSSEGKFRIRAVRENLLQAIKDKCVTAYSGVTDLAYAGKSAKERITGAMLAGTRSPWVLSNLEEVCIDFTALISEDVFPSIGYNFVIDMISKQNFNPIRANVAPIVARIFGVSTPEELVKTFPRLRAVSLILNLDALIVAKSMEGQNLSQFGNLFLLYAKQANLIEVDKVASWLTPNLKFIENGELVTRSYYTFDSKVLTPYSANWKRRIEKDRLDAIRTAEETRKAQVEASKTPFEKELDRIKEKDGLDEARIALRISIGLIPPAKRSEIYESLTPDGKSAYGDILRS